MEVWKRACRGAGAFIALVLLAGQTSAEDGMTTAIRKAEAEAARDIRGVWGDAARLPEKKVWVGYGAGLKTRVIVDYQTGTMTVETLDPTLSSDHLRAFMSDVIRADSMALDTMDPLATRMARAMTSRESAGMISPPLRVSAELSALLDARHVETARLATDQQKGLSVRRISVAFREGFSKIAAERFRPGIISHARRFRLAPSLVASIVKNESAFNPRARSHTPAFGLMQIVPASGGRDAMKFKTGRDIKPTPEYLYNPVNNVDLGTIYLHILDTRYLKRIRDPRARMYCTIAAYNTGAGNVARGLTRTTRLDALAQTVNRMAPDEVYGRLIQQLPYDETKHYLRKVVRDIAIFATWDRGAGSQQQPPPPPQPAPTTGGGWQSIQ